MLAEEAGKEQEGDMVRKTPVFFSSLKSLIESTDILLKIHKEVKL